MAVLTSTSVTGLTSLSVSGPVTSSKFTDTLSALGTVTTTGTINLNNGNLFSATLGGNCTFTVSNPGTVSSFVLILTNDGTAGRTVAWSGGSFRFPGGAAALSRTTSSGGIDIWAFFTPDSGTTYYGNIVQKALAA